MIDSDGIYVFALGIILIGFGVYELIVLWFYKVGSNYTTISGVVIKTIDKFNYSAAPSNVPIIEFTYEGIVHRLPGINKGRPLSVGEFCNVYNKKKKPNKVWVDEGIIHYLVCGEIIAIGLIACFSVLAVYFHMI